MHGQTSTRTREGRLTRLLVSGPPFLFLLVFFLVPALIMVAASFRYPPDDLAGTLARAAEVEAMLRSDALSDFLHVMYADEPLRWSPALEGNERLRFIINVLTRIRFVNASGALDLKTKEGAGGAPSGFYPWFDAPERRSAGVPIAFGHWSTLGLVNRPELLALDTGCVWGGSLTAVRVDGGRREVFQVECEQAQAPG